MFIYETRFPSIADDGPIGGDTSLYLRWNLRVRNISLHAQDRSEISISMLVIVEIRIHTLRKTVLILHVVPTNFLFTLYIYRKIKRLILQRRPSMKRISQIVVYEERELARR